MKPTKEGCRWQTYNIYFGKKFGTFIKNQKDFSL